ncbi:DUF7096 domain-containing protein [Halosimplex pelagicum]|uniref:DUF7096 domain-containing protein n=1 Tax=Halosimplex pelagicum TaxID=869886 RepID=A0A7D5P4W6_9EURY|nr:hypothetical protein [Halosimplex pelagicum]QLH80906.1 hypothetical protein HZS54_04295 [Halosimplex pelagicum]
MRRAFPVVLTVVMVVGTLAWVPAPGLAADTAQDQSNESVAPGELLAGVVGVQQAELDGEIETRSFALQLANATSNESRAAILAAQYEQLRNGSAALAERRAELNESHRNGTLSDGEYRARVAKLHAQSETVRSLANRTANESAGLPAELLESRGINATAIRTLQSDAANLTGPETAAVARSIAGPNVGDTAAAGDRPAVAENRSERGFGAAENATDGERGPAENRTRGDERGNGSAGPDDRGTPGNDTAGPTDGGNRTGASDDAGPADGGNNTDGSEGNETGTPDGDDRGTPTDGGESAGGSGSGGGGDSGGAGNGSGNSGGSGGSDGRPAALAAPLR